MRHTLILGIIGIFSFGLAFVAISRPNQPIFRGVGYYFLSSEQRNAVDYFEKVEKITQKAYEAENYMHQRTLAQSMRDLKEINKARLQLKDVIPPSICQRHYRLTVELLKRIAFLSYLNVRYGYEHTYQDKYKQLNNDTMSLTVKKNRECLIVRKELKMFLF